MTDAETPDEKEHGTGDLPTTDEITAPPAARSSRRRWPTIAVAVVLLGAAVASTLWGVDQRSDAEAVRTQLEHQREAVLVASGFVETLLSYDHQALDAQQAAVEQYTTEQFRTEYADAFNDDVREQIEAEQASSTVTVQDAWLTVDGGDEVSAVVHAISSISSAGGAAAELESYLRLRLVRLGDRWLVDDLTSLGSRDLSAPLTQPTSTDQETGTGG